jgi:1,2-phenylacetyl-CoA epoxidase PaaB subunit
MSDRHRYLVYRSNQSRQFMCVCAARDEEHALEIARKNFHIDRTAWAVREHLKPGNYTL